MVSRSAPLTDLPALPAATVAGLAKLDLHTVEDLLRHYPRRTERRGEVADFGRLVPGEYVTVQAEVHSVSRFKARTGRQLTKVVVTDGRRRVTATFFNDRWLYKRLSQGQAITIAGKVKEFKGQIQFDQPRVGDPDPEDREDGSRYAIYPASAAVSSDDIRRAVRLLLPLVDWGDDPIPEAVRAPRGLVDQATALRWIHRPLDVDQDRAAKQRLRFEEAFVMQTVLAQRRRAARAEPAAPRQRRPGGLLDAFDDQLPFPLTRGQEEVGAQIEADLAAAVPMHRLLQGEVGSGKTIVALRAMLTVVDAGGQAALLAPTEVLAQQHHRNITELLGPLAQGGFLGGAEQATRVALLTGSMSAARRRTELLDAASGQAGIVIGTHALLEEQVQFADLGLVVVDEQHRFGVEQRDALRAKGASPPHLLVMTATPIPRTVAMTVFGDLEVSTLRELPVGRAPITTNVVALREHPEWFPRVWERVREEVAGGHQAYVVSPRIAPSEEEPNPEAWEADPEAAETGTLLGGEPPAPRPPAASAVEVFGILRAGPLAGLRLGLLHGQLPPEEKDAVMRAFSAGELDVLVATTVIEVGVDVPRATAMVVLDADRFGISQLHQLRGRVGRGNAPGICLLVTSAPAGSPAMERLTGVAATTDGFELAQLDLEVRREGDVLGVAQSGRRSSLRMLRLLRDEDVIAAARDAAGAIVDADPELAVHPALAAAVDALAGEGQADYLVKA